MTSNNSYVDILNKSTKNMSFNENTRVKIPALIHLTRLGYEYLSLSHFKWDLETNIFNDIFKESIKRSSRK